MILRISILFMLAGTLLAQDPVNWTKNIVSDSLSKAKKVSICDIDLDGTQDIVVVASNQVSDTSNVIWYENDGFLNFTGHRITPDVFGARAVATADITGNGYPDILVGAPGDTMLLLYRNDGSPENDDDNWSSQHIGPKDSTIYSIAVKDIDGDSNIDFVASYYNIYNNNGGDKVRIFYNAGLDADTISYTSDILVQNYESTTTVTIDDINQDSEWDIITAAAGNPFQSYLGRDVSWWENDGSENFSQSTISSTLNGSWYLETADVDNDGDPDVLCAAWGASSLVWWANDGSGNFGTVNTIASSYSQARSIQGVDIDSDGDVDVLGTADSDNTISWFENDGSQNFTEHVISSTFQYAYYGEASDMDGDGDMDVIGTAQDDYEVALWESDLAEEVNIASGDPAEQSFQSGAVLIDFQSGFTGGNTSVFFNHNDNDNRTLLGTGIHHIAAKGFYTIVTAADTYTADLTISYAGISEWSAIDDENDLVFCYWDPDAGTEGQWEILNSANQTVNAASDNITITDVDLELFTFSKFTLASSTSDNSLPVELISLSAKVQDEGIILSWETAAELNNAGFEIWRTLKGDSNYVLLDSYENNDNLVGLGNSSSGKKYQYSDYELLAGETYTYKLINEDYNGAREELRSISATFINDLTRVGDELLPETIALSQNYPNPFNGVTLIEFDVPKNKLNEVQAVTLTIYDMLGRKVREIFNGQVVPGTYLARWNADNVAGQKVSSGTYIYQLNVNGVAIAKRLHYIK